MGTKQSRLAVSDTTNEPHSEDMREGPTSASIHLTPALIDQINGTVSSTAKQAASGLNPQQQAVMKKQLQMAYTKGADDYRKKVEAELKQRKQEGASALNPMQQAQLAKEREERENQRVEQLVAEINKKTYRAPLRDVQCLPEREACLQCYRDEKSDVLKCKEVADAFVRCARQNTEKFVGEK